MDQASALMLQRYFREYYFKRADNIKAPSEIASREFGYFPFGGGMIRHLSFNEVGTLRALLVREAPAGVYCSNSLYQDPTAEMQKKEWIRAEPIFDIDADALKLPCKRAHDVWRCKDCGRSEFGIRPLTCPTCKGNKLLEFTWSCPTCLEGTKKETFKLLEFLEQDFGISSSEISVYFSGNAGYHIQISGSRLDRLDQHGRSEIADYLTGTGVMLSNFENSKLSPTDPGWRGRIARYIRDIPVGTPPFKTNELKKRVLEIENDLKPAQIEEILNSAVSSNAIRIDAMVTADIHRIFRMPETLNNKTGLVKKRCANLSTFDPSVEPIALPEEQDLVSLEVDMCPEIRLGGVKFGPIRHELNVKVPIFLAVYLIARNAAKITLPNQSTVVSPAALRGNSEKISSTN
ncbi:MAG: hypothetical protein OK439_05445 [Thaumarchaeota archaeon]|nr:hypothetical protein [Nitrososphaerota archaeon]